MSWRRSDTLIGTMSPCRFVLASALFAATLSAVAHAETLHFKGTIGQQSVALTLDVKDDLVTDATYKYDSQKSGVPISESHLFGATVVLADDDGNNFHLHLQDATGTSVTTFAKTLKLTGTMQREELDIPVKLDLVPDSKATAKR
jgi:type 1 fimbria pilin